MPRNILLPLIGVLAAIAIVIGITSDLIGKPPHKQAGRNAHRVRNGLEGRSRARRLLRGEGARASMPPRGSTSKSSMGGPSVNIPQLFGAKAIDFGIGSNQFIAMNIAQGRACRQRP